MSVAPSTQGETKNDEAKNNATPTEKPHQPTGGKLFYQDEIGLSGWSEHQDEDNGRKYWFSSVTQESTWTEPAEVTAARTVVGHGDEVKTNNILPRTVDAHVGKIFGDDRRPGTAIAPPMIEEEAYVPVSFAKARLETMEEGMKVQQKRFINQTGKLAEYYGIVEEATQAHYLAFINGLKNKAIRRIGHYKAVLEKVNKEHADYVKTAEETINSTEAKNSQLEVEKAALLKQMKEERETLKKQQADALSALHNAEGVEAQNRRKQAEVMAAALKAERTDLSRVHDQVLEDVKTMQKEHDESLSQVTQVVEKLSIQMKKEIEIAAAKAKADGIASGTASGTAAAVEAAAAEREVREKQAQENKLAQENKQAQEEKENPNNDALEVTKTSSASPSSSLKTTTTTTTTAIDSKMVDDLNIELENVKQQATALRNELDANRKAAEEVTQSLAASSDSNDIDSIKAQLSASQQSKAMVTNKNKSLLIELETTKKQVKAAKEATKTAVNAAALSTTSSASSSSTAMDTVENDRLKKELNTMKLELKKARQQSGSVEGQTNDRGGGGGGGGGGGAAIAPLSSSPAIEGNASVEETDALRNQLEASHSELEAAREELTALRAAMDAASEDTVNNNENNEENNGEGMNEEERARIEAEHNEKLRAIEQQKSQLEAQLKAASAAANAAASAAAQTNSATSSSPATTSNSAMHARIRKCIGDGRTMWGSGDKAGCAKLYLDNAIDISKELGDDAPGVKLLKAGIKKAKGKPGPRAAVAVRKAFDAYLKAVPEKDAADGETGGDTGVSSGNANAGPSPADARKMKELQDQLSQLKKDKDMAIQQKATSSSNTSNSNSGNTGGRSPRSISSNEKALKARLKSTEARLKSATTKFKTVENELKDVKKQLASGGGGSHSAPPAAAAASSSKGDKKKEKELIKKVKTLEKTIKDNAMVVRKLEAKVEKANAAATKNAGNDGAAEKAMGKRVAMMEKKSKKAMEEVTTKFETRIATTDKKLKKETARGNEAEELSKTLQLQVDDLKKKLHDLAGQGKEMEELRAQAAEATEAKAAAAESAKVAELMVSI